MGTMAEAAKTDSGTVERFCAVMLPHLDAAYGFARWLTRDPAVAQEAMLRALRYFHAFRGGEARPWRRCRPTSPLAVAALGAGAAYGILLPMSRAQESEADHIGPILMALAGYDPTKLSGFGSGCGTQMRQGARRPGSVPIRPIGSGSTTSALGSPRR
jgi:hypothetical protein